MLTKKESLQLKGSAILIMIFLHLFNNPTDVALCKNFLFFNGVPIVGQLAKFAGICVGLYLFLSGYGLYITFQRNPNTQPWKRILKLYLNFWIVFAIFIPLGSWLQPNHYPGSWTDFLNNITGWHTTYNDVWWFLFPYILITLSAKYIIRIINNESLLKIILVIGGIYIISYLIIWQNRSYLYTHQIVYMPIIYINLLCNFSIGAIFAKYDIAKQIQQKISIQSIYSNTLAILVFVFLLMIRALCPTNIINIVYLILFVSWFIIIRKTHWIIWCLEKLGGQSTNMWLVHTFFCHYFFHDWIYDLRYPIIIYIITIIVSYFTGYLIDKINSPLQKYIISKLWRSN